MPSVPHAFALPIQEGRCPLPETVEVDADFARKFRVDSILGEWAAYFDENEPTSEL